MTGIEQPGLTSDQALTLAAQSSLEIYCRLQYPPFQAPRHIREIIRVLEAVERGETKRVIIACPPRFGKSLLTTTLFPAWYMGRNPDKGVIVATYGQELAEDFGGMIRNNVRSDIHQNIFPECRITSDTRSKQRFYTDKGGTFFAVGRGGSLTGRGSSLLAIDDPLKDRAEAASDAIRKSLHEWYSNVAYTRLAPGGAVVLVSTRWHCLLPDSLVRTPTGVSRIAELRNGDLVLTSKGHGTVITKTVTEHDGDVVCIDVAGYPEPLRVTPDHRVWTENRGWVAAGEITKKDVLSLPVPGHVMTAKEIEEFWPAAVPVNQAKGNGITGAHGRVTKSEIETALHEHGNLKRAAPHLGFENYRELYNYAHSFGVDVRPTQVVGAEILSDPDFWRVVGYWLAEGYITGGRKRGAQNVVRLTFGSHEHHFADDIESVMGRYGVAVRRKEAPGNSLVVSFSLRQAADFLLMNFGKGARTKKAPVWLSSLPDEFLKQLVIGYWRGDGHYDEKLRSVRIGSSSLGLLSALQYALTRLGVAPLLMKNISSAKAGRRSICGVSANVGTAWELRIRLDEAPWVFDRTPRSIKKHTRQFSHAGDRIRVRIRNIWRESYTGPVYDIGTTTGDFVHAGAVVHNCFDLSGWLLSEHPEENWEVINFPAEAKENDPLGRQPGESLWPERYDEKALLQIKDQVGPEAWLSLYQQEPTIEGGMMFSRENFKTWKVEPPGRSMNRYIVVDPANSKKKDSDRTVMWVVGAAPDRNYYILDGIADRLDLPERMEALFKLHRKWKPRNVGYEEYGLQADIAAIRERQESENYRFRIEPLTGRMRVTTSIHQQFGPRVSKKERIKALQPLFLQERIWFPPELMYRTKQAGEIDLTKEFLEKEYVKYPAVRHDDMLDCLAWVLDDRMNVLWPMTEEEYEEIVGYRQTKKRGSWMSA